MYTTIPTKTQGQTISAADMNTYVRDNLQSGVLAPIRSERLRVDTAQVDWQNIPADWRHLLIVWSGARTTGAPANEFLICRFNGDAGANYGTERLYGNNAGSVAAEATLTATCAIGTQPGAAATTTSRHTGGGFAWIFNYTKSAMYRMASGLSHSQWGDAAGSFEVDQFTLGHNVAAAIDRLTLLPGTGNFVAATQIDLYGLGSTAI